MRNNEDGKYLNVEMFYNFLKIDLLWNYGVINILSNLCMHNHFRIEIFAPIQMLYYILLLINQYSGNSTIYAMSDIRESQ